MRFITRWSLVLLVLVFPVCSHGSAPGELVNTGSWIAETIDFSERGQSPEAFRIPIRISGQPLQEPEPLFVGVPFPREWIEDPGAVQVVDSSDQPVPTSGRVMARWPESDFIRWLGVDFVGQPGVDYYLVPAGDRPTEVREVEVRETMEGYEVTTGPARFLIPKEGPLLARAWLDASGQGRFDDQTLVLSNATGDDLYVVDQDGRMGIIGRDDDSDQLRYENATEVRGEHAPVLRAVFRREGWYVSEEGDPMARHVTRLEFRAGQSEVRIDHALIHAHDTSELWISDYGLRFQLAAGNRAERVWLPESNQPDAGRMEIALGQTDEEVILFQEKAFSFHYIDPEEDCHFEVLRASGPDRETELLAEGNLAGNWIAVGGPAATVGVGVRDFWQTFPKEFSGSPEALTVKLWSSRGGAEMDFRIEAFLERWPSDWFEYYSSEALRARLMRLNTNAQGLARSHDLILTLDGPEDPEAAALLAFRVQNPEAALSDPAWFRFTEAMGAIHPYDPERFPREEAFSNEWFDQYMEVVRQWGDYGLIEFGNWPHVWYRIAPSGPLQGRWYAYVDRYAANMDYGFNPHVWRMYARSGDRKYLEAAEETTRHRMDSNVAHWDELESFDEIGERRLPHRMKGAYFRSNSPVPWAGGSGFHMASGTDIRNLAYWYYLSDQRRAGETLRNHAAAVKALWEREILGPFRGTRPFASYKNLGTLYQETGDPAFKEYARRQSEWLVDTDFPQGIDPETEATGLAKFGVKSSALQRVYETTGDPLVAEGLVRGAMTRSLTGMGQPPLAYFNATGEHLSEALRISGDPAIARALRRDMELAATRYYDEESGEWEDLWEGIGPSAANNVYPMGGLAMSMAALTAFEAENETEVELTPFARQGGFGHHVLAVVDKPENQAVTLDLRSLHALDPKVYDVNGEEVTNVEREYWKDQLGTLETAPTRWEVILPADLPAGPYFIDSGAGGLMWEVTWTDAPRLVFHAPTALLFGGSGGRQWGNRIMPLDFDHPAPVYFQVPTEMDGFTVETFRPVRLTSPSGERLEIDGGAQVIRVSPMDRDGLWKLTARQPTFVRLPEALPYIAYGDPARFFVPEVAESVLAGLPNAPPQAVSVPVGSRFFEVDSEPGLPQGGLMLNGNRRLEVPVDADLAQPGEGTVEFWLLPEWTSRENLRNSGGVRTVLDAGPWRLLLHRFGEMSFTALMDTDPERSESSGTLETNAGVVMEPGIWTHVALQWGQVDGEFVMELFVNGRAQRFGVRGAGMPGVQAGFFPAVPDEFWMFGGRKDGRGSVESGLAGLRFSSERRYQGDFDPAGTTLEFDSLTTAYFPLLTDSYGVSGEGQAVPDGVVLGN